MKANKEKEKTCSCNPENIQNNFIICGKPRMNSENNVAEYIISTVRFSEIKTIHEKLNSFIPDNEDHCIFFTYKDEWYICSMKYCELSEMVSNYLSSKGKSHGSDTTGSYSGINGVRENKEDLSQ